MTWYVCYRIAARYVDTAMFIPVLRLRHISSLVRWHGGAESGLQIWIAHHSCLAAGWDEQTNGCMFNYLQKLQKCRLRIYMCAVTFVTVTAGRG